MILLIGFVVSNVVVLACLQAAYLGFARRRWRIYLLVEHLATLARNGMPIHSGLRVIGRDLGGFLGSRLGRVADLMEEGKSMGEAFQSAPRAFPPLLRSMLILGEKSGNTAGFLQEMRRSYRRIAELPHQSLYIFLYPLLLSVMLNVILTAMYAGVISKFQFLLQTVGSSFAAYDSYWSRLLVSNELVLALCVAMVVFVSLGSGSIFFGTSTFRWVKVVLDRLVLVLPISGRLARDGAVQQFALCAGVYLRSGAPLPEALRAAAGVERNLVLQERLERVARAVGEGVRFSEAVKQEGLGGADLRWFTETGEASGLLSDHLLLASAHYETKVRLAARLAARLVVPFFVLLNGAIVGTAFVLLFVPIIEMLRLATRT
jgi:type II secretory pathway component PulF